MTGAELAAAAVLAVRCARPGCEHPYSDHEGGGGRCLHPAGVGCWCRGFLWIDPRRLPA